MPQRTTRNGRFLFDWVAADRSLTARTGQTLVSNRAASGVAGYDSNGIAFGVVNNEPRFATRNGKFGLWCSPARTNLVVQSDALATGWTGATATNAYATRAGISFSRLSGLSAANFLRRTVSFTGNGTKSFSLAVCSDGVAGYAEAVVYDATATVKRAVLRYTIAADGTIGAVATTGVLQGVENLGDGVYRFLVQVPSVVAANTHYAYVISDGVGMTLTSVLASRIQAEDSPYCGPMIPTGAATVTTVPDDHAVSVGYGNPVNFSVKDGLTVYVKAVHLCSAESGTNQEFLRIDDNTNAQLIIRADGVSQVFNGQYGASALYNTVGSGGVFAYGDTVEMLMTMRRVGFSPYTTCNSAFSLNGGTVAVSGDNTTTAPWIGSAFRNIYFGNSGSFTSQPGQFLMQGVRIAKGLQAMSYMQAGIP